MGIKDNNILKKLNKYNGRTDKVTHSKSSDLALKNKYIFFKGFDIVEFPKGIDWNYKHKHTTATYQVYLHSLRILRDLTNSFIVTQDERYILKAKEIINDWINSKSNESFYPKNSSWKDHSTASRMKSIIYFQQNVPNNFQLDDKVFDKILNKHCQFLSNREFYSENNHGMMSDEALLFISSYLQENYLINIYSQTAILRMERIILRLFSSSSYNLENSPEYHRLTQNLSNRFINLVDLLELKFDDKCRHIVSKSYERNRAIIKPDNSYPLIGDTGFFKAKIEKSFDHFIDYQAGVVFLNTKNEVNPVDSSYFTFKAGYLSKSHKHRDDLSLTYMHKGEDILIDSGKYTYDRKNPKKSYIQSPMAHTTISKVNETYVLNAPINDIDKLKINFVYTNDEYIHIGAQNHLYEDIEIYRDIIYFENKGMIIVDRCFSNQMNFMGQNFNLSPDIKVQKDSNKKYTLQSPSGRTLILQEHTERTLSKYFGYSNSERGFYSKKFNELLNTHQIEFRKNSIFSIFITSLLEENLAELRNIQLINNKLSFLLGNSYLNINLQSAK